MNKNSIQNTIMKYTIQNGYFLSLSYMLFALTSKYLSKTILIRKEIIICARSSILFIVLVPFIIFSGSSDVMQTKNIRLQMFRAFNSGIILYCTYFGYQNLPLGVAASIGSSEPIFIALWSLLLGYEKGWKTLLSIFGLGVSGMLLLVNCSNSMSISLSNTYIQGIIALLIGNILCSSVGYVVKTLNATDKSQTTLTYGSLFSCAGLMFFNLISGMSGNGFDFNLLQPYAWHLIGLGLSSVFVSLISIEMFRFIDPNTHISIQNLQIPLSLICGAVLSGEKILPHEYIAIAAIFSSTFLLFYRKNNSIKDPITHKNTLTSEGQKNINVYLSVAYITLIISFVAIQFLPKSEQHKCVDVCCC